VVEIMVLGPLVQMLQIPRGLIIGL